MDSHASEACGNATVVESMPLCTFGQCIYARFIVDSFVVDAADHEKFEAAKTELHNLLQKPQLAHIPLLVLGNKNDLVGSYTVEQVIEKLYVLFRAPCTCLLVCISGLKAITNREVSCYSISAKNQVNIDITLQWLIKHGKSKQ